MADGLGVSKELTELRSEKKVLVLSDSGHMFSPGFFFPDYLEIQEVLPLQVTMGSVLVASILKSSGYKVHFLDNYSYRDRSKRLHEALRSAPDAICISTTFTIDPKSAIDLIVAIRAVCPSVPIVLGGAGIVSHPELADLADCVVPGDGESAAVSALDHLFSLSPRAHNAGVWFPGNEGGILSALDTSADIDQFRPDWSLVNRFSNEYYTLETQRGCRWRCAFCNYPPRAGNSIRYRTVESVINEVTHNWDRYGIHRYVFADSTFNSPIERCIQLLNEISKLPFSIEWVGYARVDWITPEFSDAAVRSGCKDLFLGIESGDDRILRYMNKGFDVTKIKKEWRY